MVSEDSQDLGRLAMVHRLHDGGDLQQASRGQVATSLHETNHIGKLCEVGSLRRLQRVLLEERHDLVPQVVDALHAVPEEVLAVVVVPSIAEDLPAAEEVDERLEHVAT